MSPVTLLLAAALSPQATADTPTPTADQQAVYKALSPRHEAPSCDALDAMSEDPVATYAFVIEHAQQPPWAGMRAARCLMVNHPTEAKPHMAKWVTSPEHRGLAILAVQQLDELPLDIATEIATLALTEGPDVDAMRGRIARNGRPEIAALATELAPVAPR